MLVNNCLCELWEDRMVYSESRYCCPVNRENLQPAPQKIAFAGHRLCCHKGVFLIAKHSKSISDLAKRGLSCRVNRYCRERHQRMDPQSLRGVKNRFVELLYHCRHLALKYPDKVPTIEDVIFYDFLEPVETGIDGSIRQSRRASRHSNAGNQVLPRISFSYFRKCSDFFTGADAAFFVLTVKGYHRRLPFCAVRRTGSNGSLLPALNPSFSRRLCGQMWPSWSALGQGQFSPVDLQIFALVPS